MLAAAWRHALPSIARPKRLVLSHASPAFGRLLGATIRRRRCTAAAAGQSGDSASADFSPRWLSDLRNRTKACLLRPLPADDSKRLQEQLRRLDHEWIELLAGREGYLTSGRWRGLDRHSVSWGDMHGHVNNVVYNRYAESARVNWLLGFLAAAGDEHRQRWAELMTPKGVGLILRSIRSDYKFPLTYPDRVTVLHKVAREPLPGSDSILLEALILSEKHKRPAARCFEDIAVYDYRAAKKAQLDNFMIDDLAAAYRLQESNRVKTELEALRLQLLTQQMEEKCAP